MEDMEKEPPDENYMDADEMDEIKSEVESFETADDMVKAAEVELIGYENTASGYISVLVRGDVGACKSAVEAGAMNAERLGELVAQHVIPRPHTDVEGILPAIK